MSCNHCQNSVETNVKEIEVVTEVSVNLEKGGLNVIGTATEEQIHKVLEMLGFEFKVKL